MKVYIVRPIYDTDMHVFSTADFAEAFINAMRDPSEWFYDEFEVIL